MDFVPAEKLSAGELSQMRVANGGLVSPQGKGNVQLMVNGEPMEVREVYYFPDLQYNLFSLGQTLQRGKADGLTGVMTADSLELRYGEELVLSVPWENNVLRLEAEALLAKPFKGSTAEEVVMSSGWSQGEWEIPAMGMFSNVRPEDRVAAAWGMHEAMGHLNHKSLAEAVDKEIIVGVDKELGPVIRDLPACEACITAKQHREPFGESSREGSWALGELLCMDLCGPFRVTSRWGNDYSLMVKDRGYSRAALTVAIRQKSDATAQAIRCIKYFEKQSGRTVKVVRFDRGGEFLNSVLQSYCCKRGIKIELTTAYTSQQNALPTYLIPPSPLYHPFRPQTCPFIAQHHPLSPNHLSYAHYQGNPTSSPLTPYRYLWSLHCACPPR